MAVINAWKDCQILQLASVLRAKVVEYILINFISVSKMCKSDVFAWFFDLNNLVENSFLSFDEYTLCLSHFLAKLFLAQGFLFL